MKVLNICLAGPFSDGWNYQENLLTKYQQLNGNKVTVLTSKWSWDSNGKMKIVEKDNYINEDNVNIIRLSMKGKENFQKKIKEYNGVYENLIKINPDIIFVHGCQFVDVKNVVKYARKHSVKIYVDNHADFSNSATNWLSKNILHGIIWKHYAKMIEPYTTKFFGVLPARVEFLKNIYKIPSDKVELLVMGADDEIVSEVNNDVVRSEVRKRYNVEKDDFLIISGGKIDLAKWQVLNLIDAVKNINNPKIKLIVFGSVDDNIKNKLIEKCDNNRIKYIGWLDSNNIYKLMASSDIAIYPGRHSVLWEQTVGTGIPMIVKYWEGTTHIDVGGNVKFLYTDTIEEIEDSLNYVLNVENYNLMKKIALEEGNKAFSYKEIAKKSIN